MDIIPGPVIIEPETNRQGPQPQPVQALGGLDPVMDDNAVRQAIANAEANNLDPQTITMDDLAQGSIPRAEVPQKFLKPDGTADVDKIQTSTRQLDEALQKKEEAVNKTVDDYMREYKEKEAKFRNLPNPERLAASLPVQAPPPQEVPQNFEEIVRRDYAVDSLGTMTRILELMIQKKFAPIEEEKKIESVRGNIQKIAEVDSRILRPDVFAAVKAKLDSDPDYWKLKNPHKAAWLEVKDEMRLGEPSQVQAQPSRPSPVLGGGTPPSVPSSTVQASPQNILQSLHQIDLRDKKQEALGDEAVRAALAAGNRW